MTNIRDVLSANLKKYRAELGFTQAKLAEKANTSTHYIAMMELKHKFPSPQMIEQLAKALKVDTYELFLMPPSIKPDIQQIERSMLRDLKTSVSNKVECILGRTLERVLEEAVDEVVTKRINELENKCWE